MKTFNLVAIVATVALIGSTAVYAKDAHNNMHVQNFSKRPYAQPLPKEAYQKAEQFEGATLVRGDLNEEGSVTEQKQQVQRLNNISRRPY